MTMTAPLMGSQTPRFSSVPPYSVSLGDEAIDFAAKAGLFLDPWQQLVLRDSLGMSGGKWTAPQVGLLVPRQSGKGSVLEARELFGLFALGEGLIIHSAHKFDTSQEHFLRMRTLIESNPDLDRHVQATPTANGKEAIILRNGNRLKFKARTVSGSGRGFSGDLLVLDEAMLLPEAALDAMLPTLITRKNPQTWFTSSAGTPDSAALWRIVKRGRAQADRLAYFEWGCESGVDATDRRNWALANPGLGYRVSMQALEDDFDQMSEEGFAREHLGVWDDAASGVFDLALWASLCDPSSAPSGALSFGLEVSDDRSWSVLAAAGPRADGLTHADIVSNDRGTGAVVPTALRLQQIHPMMRVHLDPSSQAGSLARPLLDAGVPVVEMSAREVAQACGLISDAVERSELRHLGQAPLDMAIAGAQRKVSGDAYRWDRRGQLDIAPLGAVTLAVWAHLMTPPVNALNTIW